MNETGAVKNEVVQQYREMKMMEPIFRMQKLIAQEDELKATTLMSVVVQYISDHYLGQKLAPANVQQIIRAVLLREEDGSYFAKYLLNELQVKITGWLLLLSADLPVTLEQLGQLVEGLACALAPKQCLQLSAEDVLQIMTQLVIDLNQELAERVALNRDHYLTELRTLLIQ